MFIPSLTSTSNICNLFRPSLSWLRNLMVNVWTMTATCPCHNLNLSCRKSQSLHRRLRIQSKLLPLPLKLALQLFGQQTFHVYTTFCFAHLACLTNKCDASGFSLG